MAFAKREIMNGIQQIGLSHSVIPEKTIYFGRERNFCLENVFPVAIQVAKVVFFTEKIYT